MTVLASTIDAIHEAVAAFAAAQVPAVSCAFPNAKFTPPRDANSRDLPWMRLAMPDGDLAAEMLWASTRPTFRGFFTLSFFVPYDSGTQRLTALVDAACSAFREGISIGDAVVLRLQPRSVPTGTADWMQHNLTVFFRAQ